MAADQRALCDCLTDVTLREGSQQPADLRGVSVAAKLEILEVIKAVGVKHLELTAFAPGEWYADADELAAGCKSVADSLEIEGLYFNKRGAERMVQYPHLQQKGIFHTAATSGYRIKNYNQPDLENVAERLEKLSAWLGGQKIALTHIVLSTAWGEKAESLSIEESTDFITELLSLAKKSGAALETLTLADTEGLATSDSLTSLVKGVKQQHPSLEIVAHLHPDSARAEELVTAGIEAGVDRWDGAWGGVGGSPFADRPGGNLDILSAIRAFKAKGLPTGFDEKEIPKLLKLLEVHLAEKRILSC